MTIPRIRGRVGQATEPPEMAGKWFFEMFLTEMGGGDGESMGQFGPWDDEKTALAELRSACRLACEAIEKRVTGKVSGRFIDMQTNEVRSWDAH